MSKATRRDYAPIQATAQAFNLKPPIRGLNFANTLVSMDQSDALVMNNAIARNYGAELRKGHIQWSKGPVPGVSVNTIMQYSPARGDALSPGEGGPLGSGAKLFACSTDMKIYDVTVRGADPVVSQEVLGQTIPGEWSYTLFANIEKTFLLAVSDGGGYWTYETTGGWVEIPTGTAALQIEFPAGDSTTTKDFEFIFAYHGRLFFVKKNSSAIYYMIDSGAIAGKVEMFDVGPLLPHGGDIKCMAIWTVDAGDGIDDKLVMVASEGDLLIFSGTDPGDVTAWNMDGRWFVGQVPRGRRFMAQYGGDLMILCSRGLVRLSELLRGQGLFLDMNQSVSRVNNQLSKSLATQREEKYFEIKLVESERVLFINVPRVQGATGTVQWMMDTNTLGWSHVWDIDMVTCETLRGSLFFVKPDNYIYEMFVGNTDVETPDLSGTPTSTQQVVGELQTAFVPVGEDMRRKQFVLCKPTFQSPSPPKLMMQANVNWSFKTTVGSPTGSQEESYRWDNARWDQARWAGESGTYEGWFGLEGFGTHVSLRIKFMGDYQTIFTNWIVVANPAGVYG